MSLTAFQRVEDEYSRGDWTKHHGHMLEYEEASDQNPKPSISLRITEPDDEEQKNWKLSIVTSIPVSYTWRLLFVLELLLNFTPLLTPSHFCSSLCLWSLYVTV